MNRILRRPMFRRGGSTNEGITSGLDTPRVNYQSGMNFDMAKILQDTSKQVQDPAIRSAYQPYFQRPQGEGLNRFLMDFGLNLMSTPPRGGFLSTAATAARGPLKTLNEDIDAQRLGRQAGEADLFKTLLQGNIDIAAEAAGNTGGGKTYAKLEVANDIERTMLDIIELKKRADGGEDVTDELSRKQARLDYLSKENAVGKSLMQQTEFAEDVLKSIVKRLENEMIDDPNNPGQKIKKYPDGDNDPELLKEAYRQYAEFFASVPDRVEEADGGRIGYQQGSMPGAMTETLTMKAPGMEMQETATMDQGPEDKIDYATLRARLPQEIGDDIVKLLAASPEALEDFATIATQQDVDQFNKKYNVNLVLPSEA